MTTLPLGERLAAKRSQAALPHVKRSSIEVYEDSELHSWVEVRRFWVARLDGPLSTGEEIALQREADSAAGAIAALEAAIAEQGWEIR